MWTTEVEDFETVSTESSIQLEDWNTEQLAGIYLFLKDISAEQMNTSTSARMLFSQLQLLC